MKRNDLSIHPTTRLHHQSTTVSGGKKLIRKGFALSGSNDPVTEVETRGRVGRRRSEGDTGKTPWVMGYLCFLIVAGVISYMCDRTSQNYLQREKCMYKLATPTKFCRSVNSNEVHFLVFIVAPWSHWGEVGHAGALSTISETFMWVQNYFKSF